MALNENTYPIDLPEYAVEALDILENAGHQAWCVGGYIRDALRGLPGSDIDIATSAHWKEVKNLFETQGHKSFETGTKHGTITVSLNNHIVEITTFRNEGTYSDRRHPDSIIFVDTIEEDLARRDFTMNALAYHPSRGVCDPFGGSQDIKAGLIRSVGDAKTRFNEDALRILRACRFASQLGFSIESDTFKAMLEQKELLDHIAVERIFHELSGFVCGECVHDALMDCVDVVGQIIPATLPMVGFDQKTPYHIYDVLEHTAYCMQFCPPQPLLRWAAFFHDIGKPAAFFTDEKGVGHFYGHAKLSTEIARATLKHLRAPSALIHKVLLVVEHHDDVIPASPKAVKRALRRFNEDPQLFRVLCELKKGDALAQAPQCHHRIQIAQELEDTLDAILATEEAFSLKDLAIRGEDILALGVSPGPLVGKVLENTLGAVIDESVPNEHEALLRFASDLVKIEAPSLSQNDSSDNSSRVPE